MTFIGFHMYQKDKRLQQSNEIIQPNHEEKILTVDPVTSVNEPVVIEGTI
jgi:hypothetical protein